MKKLLGLFVIFVMAFMFIACPDDTIPEGSKSLIPQNVKISLDPDEVGAVFVDWDAVDGAIAYEVNLRRMDNLDSFKQTGITTGTRYRQRGMMLAIKGEPFHYFVSVTAIGADGGRASSTEQRYDVTLPAIHFEASSTERGQVDIKYKLPLWMSHINIIWNEENLPVVLDEEPNKFDTWADDSDTIWGDGAPGSGSISFDSTNNTWDAIMNHSSLLVKSVRELTVRINKTGHSFTPGESLYFFAAGSFNYSDDYKFNDRQTEWEDSPFVTGQLVKIKE